MAGCFLASHGGIDDTLTVGMLCFRASVAYVSFSTKHVTLYVLYLVFSICNWSPQLLFVGGQFCHVECPQALVSEASTLCKNICIFN